FVEYTHLVGALGFQRAVDLLGGSVLVCIDEFELDDPGDTLLMTRLIRELSDRGVAVAATSNTLPEALGEGRFAAQDFLREIQSMAERFEVLRVDGEDYRRRDSVATITALPETTVRDGAGYQRRDSVASVAVVPEPTVRERAKGADAASLDDFEGLLGPLTGVHPSGYGAMIDGVTAAHVTGMRTVGHHHDVLRFVVVIDRLYDRQVPMLVSAADCDLDTDSDPAAMTIQQLYTPELLGSGYRKKYFRSLSRLASLAHDGARSVSAERAVQHPS